MKNKLRLVLTIGLISILTASITSVAAATGRKANLKSVGNLDAVIEGKKIYISSGDLRYLADEIDYLEDTYKVNTVDALNSIGTYFKTDGTVVYDVQANEVDTSEEKRILSFKNLKDAISASQSVVSLSQTQATDKDGRPLYYADKAASDSKNLMKTTTTNTGYPVYYQAATTNNLTAGVAAWVNGILLKGTGSDNAAYYAKGIEKGKNTIDPDSPNYQEGYKAGETKAKVGTATPDKVLAGYTFTNTQDIGLTGTMVDRGTMNWNPDRNTTETIQPGYYSGGTLDSSGAYNAGVTEGKNTIDPNSSNYKEGLKKGTSNLLIDIRHFYGGGNNSKVVGNPITIPGYETVLFGFQSLVLTGGLHVAAISADNSALTAGSLYGTSISASYVQFLLKPGTPYMIKEYDISQVLINQSVSFDVEGYRLAGAVFHCSNYSSTNTSTMETWQISVVTNLNTETAVCTNGIASNATMKCTAKLLYIPDGV